MSETVVLIFVLNVSLWYDRSNIDFAHLEQRRIYADTPELT